MNIKKTVAIATAVGALAAVSVPAMAFENEFHGMYRSFGYVTNALSGGSSTGSFNLDNGAATDKYIEQRARLQYIAKSSDDLKLVTHFEIDNKFGGANTSGKYVPGTTGATTSATNLPTANGDGGGLDTDKISLETKSVYLDFNVPMVGTNVKIGAQPYNDSMFGLFGNFDATGVVFSKKINDQLSASYGYFTVGSSSTSGMGYSALTFGANAAGKGTNYFTQDLNTFDVKYALSKDLTLGASYYVILDKVNDLTTYGGTGSNHTLGLNGAGKFGLFSFNAAAAYQTGKSNPGIPTQGTNTTAASGGAPQAALSTTGGYSSLTNAPTSAFAVALATKTAVGPGNILLSGLYLSGDKDAVNGVDKYNKAWQSIGAGVNYFGQSNMWLLVRNVATINSSTAVGGSADVTRGGRGLEGVFAGYEGTANKLFYNGNIGWAQVAEKRTADSKALGTEVNGTVGYKLYDNMSVSATAAYLFLGDGYGKDNGTLLPVNNGTTNLWTANTAYGASNPFMTNIQINYTF